ncbi:MAG TPA: sigma-54 dependent transcriptional regulator [Thiobacillus sp.]|nr:MAG: sigma-54-dependent Fis family transcriptional regulator [Hydrogenophilales bacterium 28-61-11]OYZ58850.1 MAG: sigma-54-dependent Fis family transcriptional regulator [Hydrogenophilales bacterium 16-61-112]OZA47851.1 MAG: sigma-54-dependent Fis family transcriptional regulator [Hydrogenophilales bacterium 17-61-76]HQT30180.1 sigma-54 dependent transcriptional regulator [Thiobacillus sp.]HQT69249.1 sigma-54 dependent transcriptional regulator [Thiobacillus sp.]
MNMAHSPRILLVDDEPDLLDLMELTLVKMGLETDRATSVAEARAQLSRNTYDLCLTDMRLPDGEGLEVVALASALPLPVPVAVITAFGNAGNAVAALKAGAFDYLAKPVALDQLRALIKSALNVPGTAQADDPARDLIGQSAAMQDVRVRIAKLARTQAPVHIAGESGSGKELAARLIHRLGSRAEQPFVAVNCGAIPETLMESEFFGYRKGAFTGAEADRNGFFQAADGGTLFLDEVADLPLSMQVKLLRVLQEKKVRKVGATAEESIDVRIVSATHQSLAALVEAGRFRQDLYYRLNVIDLMMPSLRERVEDIPEMARFLLAKLGGADVKLDREAEKALSAYAFPGNVRELENTLERALALCDNQHIQAADLNLAPALPATHAAPGSKYPLQDYLDQMERAAILEALEQTRFNKTAAARVLGVTFRSLRYRLERLGIE